MIHNSEVKDSRRHGNYIRRRRKTLKGENFYTIEILESQFKEYEKLLKNKKLLSHTETFIEKIKQLDIL